MWIVSSPKWYGVAFLLGLVAGFYLGAHAVMGAEIEDSGAPKLQLGGEK